MIAQHMCSLHCFGLVDSSGKASASGQSKVNSILQRFLWQGCTLVILDEQHRPVASTVAVASS